MLGFLLLFLTSNCAIIGKECGTGMNKLRFVNVSSKPDKPKAGENAELTFNLYATRNITEGNFVLKQFCDYIITSDVQKVQDVYFSTIAGNKTIITEGNVTFKVTFRKASNCLFHAESYIYLGDKNDPDAGTLCVTMKYN